MCRDEDEFFLESDDRSEARPLEWLGYEGCLDLVIVELTKQRPGRASPKLHVRLGVCRVVPRKDDRQPHTGSTLERTQAQRATYDPMTEFLLGLVGQSQQTLGVLEQ